MRSKPVGLGAIFAAFFRLGVTSFGGGTVAWIHRDLVLRRGWVDDPRFLSGAALSQIMPGSNGVNLAVELGQFLRGGRGAATAVAGLLCGPFAIAVALAAAYAHIPQTPIVHALLDGVAAGAIGLTLATGLRLAQRGTRGAGALAVMFATVFAVGGLRWPMLPVVIALAPASIGLARFGARGSGKPTRNA